MMIFRVWPIVLLLFSFVTGCNDTSSTTPPAAKKKTTAPAIDDVTLSVALEAWRTGNKKSAVLQFAAIGEKEGGEEPVCEALAITEDGFLHLSQQEKSRVQQEAIETCETIKELTQHVAELGETALKEGKPTDACEYFLLIKAISENLKSENHLLIIRQVGQYTSKIAEDGLARIPD